MILSARKLRDSSNHLLDLTKRAMEIAIEQDENAALAFIADHSGNVTDVIKPGTRTAPSQRSKP